MTSTAGPMDRDALLAADQRFFDALVAGDVGRLDGLLDPGFLLVAVDSGAVVTRAELLAALSSGAVVFPAIAPAPEEAVVRRAGPVGIVVGRTEMSFTDAEGATFGAGSRYTHVFEQSGDGWRLVSAQGTPIGG